MVAAWVWVPVSLILFGVCIICWLSAWDVYRLRCHGTGTTAHVSGFRHTKDADSDPRHYVLVIFCLPDGTEVEAESMSSNPDGSNNLVLGDAMDIVYDPAKPTRICVTQFDEHRMRVSDGLAYAISAVAAALFAALTLAQVFTA